MASSARSAARSCAGVSTTAPTSSSKSSSARAARRPDRLVRTADLRDVGEVEDRQPEPGLGDLAAAPLPHRPDVALEGVEVAQGRRSQDRRTEPTSARRARRRRSSGPPCGRSPSTRSARRGDPQAAREVVVEGRDRLPEERRVVGQPRAAGPTAGADGRSRGRPSAARTGETDRAAAGQQPPGRAARGVALAGRGSTSSASARRRGQNGLNIIKPEQDEEADHADEGDHIRARESISATARPPRPASGPGRPSGSGTSAIPTASRTRP